MSAYVQYCIIIIIIIIILYIMYSYAIIHMYIHACTDWYIYISGVGTGASGAALAAPLFEERP